MGLTAPILHPDSFEVESVMNGSTWKEQINFCAICHEYALFIHIPSLHAHSIPFPFLLRHLSTARNGNEPFIGLTSLALGWRASRVQGSAKMLFPRLENFCTGPNFSKTFQGKFFTSCSRNPEHTMKSTPVCLRMVVWKSIR